LVNTYIAVCFDRDAGLISRVAKLYGNQKRWQINKRPSKKTILVRRAYVEEEILN